MCILTHTHLLVPPHAWGTAEQNISSSSAHHSDRSHRMLQIRLLTSPHMARDCGDPEPLGQEGVWGGGTIHPGLRALSTSWQQRCGRQNPAPARASSSLGTLQPPPPPQGWWLRCLESVARTGKTSYRLKLPSILQG